MPTLYTVGVIISWLFPVFILVIGLLARARPEELGDTVGKACIVSFWSTCILTGVFLTIKFLVS